jgi:integrase
MPIRISERAYQHRGKWRYRVTLGPGVHRWAPSCDSDAEALKAAEGFAAGLQGQVDLTVGGAADRYIHRLIVAGNQPQSVDWAASSLRRLCGQLAERSLGAVTVQQARAQYARLAEETAVTTHHVDLRRARALWQWAMEEGLCKSNPWKLVRPIGRAKRGKEQHTLDEAKQLTDLCVAEMMTDDGALAILLALLRGLRGGEIRGRCVRDVDAGGRALHIRVAKTPAGQRTLEIPTLLRPAIRARCTGRAPTDPLLRNKFGGRPSKGFMNYVLTRYCKRAGIPRVVPHALRGQYATVLFEGGVDPDKVARALGQRSAKVTEAHYATRAAVQASKDLKRERAMRKAKAAVPGVSPRKSPARRSDGKRPRK